MAHDAARQHARKQTLGSSKKGRFSSWGSGQYADVGDRLRGAGLARRSDAERRRRIRSRAVRRTLGLVALFGASTAPISLGQAAGGNAQDAFGRAPPRRTLEISMTALKLAALIALAEDGFSALKDSLR